MNKSLINDCMLFKLNNYSLCVLLSDIRRSSKMFYNKNKIINNVNGLIDLDIYNEDLTLKTMFADYNVLAIKQFSTTSEALYHVLNNIEPKEWDWVRKEKKEEIIPFTFILKEKKKVKSVKLPACIRSRK